MHSYKTLLEYGVKRLEDAGIHESVTDAWFLFEYIFEISKAEYYMNPEQSVESDKESAYMIGLNKRVNHIPLQHITGKQEFMGLEIEVNEHVLIPRQDTEQLVEYALDRLKHAANLENFKVLDMCTGSGCIAISLAKLGGVRQITGVDISNNALTTAKRNAKNNGVEYIKWICSNLFEMVEGKFDMIISNPPYIPTEEIDGLMEEVKCHDPKIALDGKEDGLFYYQKITETSKLFLEENGLLLYEIGYNQGEAVKGILLQHGFVDVEVYKDLSGLDRVVVGKRSI